MAEDSGPGRDITTHRGRWRGASPDPRSWDRQQRADALTWASLGVTAAGVLAAGFGYHAPVGVISGAGIAGLGARTVFYRGALYERRLAYEGSGFGHRPGVSSPTAGLPAGVVLVFTGIVVAFAMARALP